MVLQHLHIFATNFYCYSDTLCINLTVIIHNFIVIQ